MTAQSSALFAPIAPIFYLASRVHTRALFLVTGRLFFRWWRAEMQNRCDRCGWCGNFRADSGSRHHIADRDQRSERESPACSA